MSRKGNPYDNTACESFMRALKYEEVHRQEYRDLAERLHSAARLSAASRVRTRSAHTSAGGLSMNRSMRFLRHNGIYRSDVLINLDSAVPDSGDHQHARIGVAAERPPCLESPSPSTPWRIGHPLRWKTLTPGAAPPLPVPVHYPM